MTLARVRAVVKKIRYKSGWRFRVETSFSRRVIDIEITADVLDAYHPSRKPIDPPRAYVTDAHDVPDADTLLKKIFLTCQRLELHECAEWFTYRRRRLYDPHK